MQRLLRATRPYVLGGTTLVAFAMVAVTVALRSCYFVLFDTLGSHPSLLQRGAQLFLLATASTILGLAMLRFGARALPLRASARRSVAALALLSVGLLVPLVYVVKGTLALCSLLTHPPHLTEPPEEGLDGLAQGTGLALAEGLHDLVLAGHTFALMIFASIALPSAVLLVRHLFPRWWGHRYVLFLRRFDSLSNSTIVGAIADALPPKASVVFVTSPYAQSSAWDPFFLSVSGFSLRHPLRTVPVHLVVDAEPWREVVEGLATGAMCIVVDTSEPSESMVQEIQIAEAAAPRIPVVWLSRWAAPERRRGMTARFEVSRVSTAIAILTTWLIFATAVSQLLLLQTPTDSWVARFFHLESPKHYVGLPSQVRQPRTSARLSQPFLRQRVRPRVGFDVTKKIAGGVTTERGQHH